MTTVKTSMLVSTCKGGYPSRWSVIGAVLLLVSGLSACDNTIEPLTDEGQDLFAVYGYLDAEADTQFVRVEALRSSVLDPPATLDDISVVSVDENTGEQIAWKDSSIVLDNDEDGVIFYAAFLPLSGHTYRLRMFRPDRSGASVTTTIPESASLVVDPPFGQELELKQRINLADVGQPKHVELRYEVRDPESGKVSEVDVAYGLNMASPDDWYIDVFLKVDQMTVLQHLDREPEDKSVGLRSVSVSYSVLSPEWAEGNPVSSMMNTTGFFGAIGYFRQDWQLDPNTVFEIGYVNEQ